jgi:sulfite exporter TauE/SafE
MRFSHRLPPFTSGLALGSLTPLLPCGPLHALLGLALISANPLHGAEIGLGFALGTLPLLWAAQMGYQRLAFSLGSARAIRLRRGLSGLAALIIAKTGANAALFPVHDGRVSEPRLTILPESILEAVRARIAEGGDAGIRNIWPRAA